VILALGDRVYLGSFLTRVNVFGEISDLDTPDQVSFTMEGYGANSVLSTPVIKGDRGDRGDNAPLGNRQFPVLDSEADLPSNLTDDPVDIGKYWVIRVFDGDGNEIGSNWAMWNGTDFEIYKEGEPGQPGPVPDVTPVFHLVTTTAGWAPTDVANGYRISKTGNPYQPTWTIEIYQELLRGPAGSGSAWSLYDATNPPALGQAPIWNGTKFAPTDTANKYTQFGTYPEGHFVSNPIAIGTSVPIGTALLPSIPWDTVLDVSGHFRVTGVSVSTNPFLVGIDVRLGSPTGTLVARGYGNISGYIELQAHGSTSTSPNDAITSTNGRGRMAANSTGAPATLYVSAFNNGAIGEFSFDAEGAQLSFRAYPV
jgi:hypothetical protein